MSLSARRVSMVLVWCFALVADFSFCSLEGARAQAPTATAPVTTSQLMPSRAPFDVSTVRESPPGTLGGTWHSANGDLAISNVTLGRILERVYGVPQTSILGGPAWVKTKGFDVRAKTVDVVPIDDSKLPREQRDAYNSEKQEPIRKLLEERFKLKVRFEKRERPIFALKVAKDGPKLRSAGEEDNPRQMVLIRPGTGMVRMSGLTMDQLASQLTNITTATGGPSVQNKTGVAGHFDIDVTWATDTSMVNTDALPLKRALEETLGLTIESQKGMVPVLVIDHVELPTEN